MAPAVQPAEVQFAQRLASSEKGVRDRAVRKLRQYLSVKTQSETGGFSQEELLKIWKGLFYCLWVQDEPLLQEELANTISQLIHVVNSSEAQHLFIQTFWQTMNREWKGIDKLHLDKYYMLIRLVLRQSFEVLKRNGWEESQIKLFLDVLMKEILCPESQSPDGVRFHFIDIYLDELSKVGGKELLADQNLKFIDPFCKIAAKTKDHTLVQTVARGVFEVIVDQSPLAPEDTVEEQKTQVTDGDLSGEETCESEVAWKKAGGRKKTALSKCLSRKDGISEERRKASGTLEDTGLLLQFDYKAVADRLLKITNKKNIPPFNRKHLYKLIKKFQGLSEGSISQLSFPEDIAADEDDQALSQRRHKKKRRKLLEKADLEKEKGNKVFLAEEEDSEGSIQKRKRKKKKRSHPQPETWDLKDSAKPTAQNRGGQPASAQKQAPQVPVARSRAEAESSTREESSSKHPPSVSTHRRRKRLKRKSLGTQGEIWDPTGLPLEDKAQSGPASSHPQGPAATGSPADGAPVRKRKRKLRALPVNGSGQATQTQCGRPQKKKAEPSSLDLYSLSNQKTTILKKRKKMKEMSNLVEHNGMQGCRVQQFQALGSSRTVAPLKKQPLRTEKDFVKFDTHFLPKPLFFRKAKSGAATRPAERAVQLSRTPSSAKKVTFGLNRNTTAEFKKTDKSILVSPTGPSRVAFNPEQRPLHGVLKTPTSSPTSTPPATKKPLATTPKRRPTAMDFF